MKAPFTAVVLAAGLGKRMSSDLPKVLHPALGRPLLHHVLDQLDPLKPKLTVVVVGHRASLVRNSLRGRRVSFAEQVPQLGTGHAVQMAWSALEPGPDTLLVLAGDMPLIRTATLKRLLERHAREGNAVTFLSGILEDPAGYGRVIRDSKDEFVKIVEERDATPEERSVAEVNSGIYCFLRAPLQEALGFLRADNRQQEYYLTDTLSFIKGRGGRIGVERASDSRELFGVNNPEQLAMVEEALRAWGES
ncbi:MAG: UDP-N-acetylglucosamine pyrophosphorylase [Candidatus Eisenbacteria bacterium]|uniref:UDP-N-acetylglucosamine pyrophosphorylase n=1 Tax=Eiseniibacteriota bacterium TaxID=2212470 RepID=A0A538TEZ1_UNCEI|nr:MAG: UDP-N-acetylglucosamine pyrophosphorylase [Candidatus Eisenbacteria bacterium]